MTQRCAVPDSAQLDSVLTRTALTKDYVTQRFPYDWVLTGTSLILSQCWPGLRSAWFSALQDSAQLFNVYQDSAQPDSVLTRAALSQTRCSSDPRQAWLSAHHLIFSIFSFVCYSSFYSYNLNSLWKFMLWLHWYRVCTRIVFCRKSEAGAGAEIQYFWLRNTASPV